jgi:cation diffusion facilitator family transporter
MNAPMSELRVAHDYLGAYHDENARRTRWVVLLTCAMMLAEIVGGWLTGSMALLADGFHMATDAAAIGVAAFAYSYARRHVHNPRFSFGTGKVGDLAGFASSLVLAIVSLGIAAESVVRLVQHPRIDFGSALPVAVAGLLVNLASAALLSGGHHHGHDHGHAHHHHDHNYRAVYLHVVSDALVSVMAISALLAGRYLGWVWLDPAMGLVGSVVIARWSWSLMKDSAAVLLDTTDPHVADQVRTVVGELDASILDLHVWRVGPGALAVIVDVAEPASAAGIRERLSGLKGVVHLTVQTHPAK